MSVMPNSGLGSAEPPRDRVKGCGWRTRWQLLALVVSAGWSLGLPAETNKLTLPGTQPNEHVSPFNPEGVTRCARCHARTPSGSTDPFTSWQGSMMAQSARDPLFLAALAIANQDIPGSGEYCIRCHAPRGWFEGRSSAPDASLLTIQDRDGVSCEVCHHLVDPFSDEARQFAKQLPVGLGNGGMVLDSDLVRMRGPYANTRGTSIHQFLKSPYHGTSELCGNCHNVSNPFAATNVFRQPPYAFGHIERTYSEWALSEFAQPGKQQSCQSCHFPQVTGGGWAVYYATNNGIDMHRDYFVTHMAVGGSTWVQDAVAYLHAGDTNVNAAALTVGKGRARELLRTAAALGLEFVEGRVLLMVTNLTGHKLPTGYPEGRRMWVNARCYQGTNLLAEAGAYGEIETSLSVSNDRLLERCRSEVNQKAFRRAYDEQKFTVPTLLDPVNTRVYECKPGISAEQAATYQKRAGPSFHFILNDVTTKDNRIPPRGYRRSAFSEHLAAPVDTPRRRTPPSKPVQPLWVSTPLTSPPPAFCVTVASFAPDGYADGQYWDELEFDLPAGTDQVEVRLMYQSVSWEYIKFLVENNRTDCGGLKLLAAWEATGRCPPEVIASVTKLVQK